MKKSIIKTICFTLIAITLFFCFKTTAGCSTYMYSEYASMNNVMLMQSENQVYLVGTKNNVVSIDAVYPQSYNIMITLSNNAYTYNLYNDHLVILCSDKSTNQTELVFYNIKTDIITSFNIEGTHAYSYCNIAFDNTYIYLAKTNGYITVYNLRGKKINEFYINDTIHSLICNYSNSIYVITRQGLYSVDNNSCDFMQSYKFSAPARFINNSDFVDSLGYVYRISGNSLAKLISSQSNVRYPSGGIYKECVIISDSNKLFSVKASNNETIKSYSISSSVEQFFLVDDTVVALSYNGSTPIINLFSYDDFKNVVSNKNNNINNSNNNADNNSTSGSSDNKSEVNSNSELKEESRIYSDTYNFDYNNMKIRNINPQTTVAQFKKNIQYNGYEVEFFRYGGNEITGGYVGTATIVRFYNNETTYEFELCVVGDLTGEGNVNSRDKNMIFDFLLDEVNFTGVFLDAADLDNSGNIDTVDLILLLRMIK